MAIQGTIDPKKVYTGPRNMPGSPGYGTPANPAGPQGQQPNQGVPAIGAAVASATGGAAPSGGYGTTSNSGGSGVPFVDSAMKGLGITSQSQSWDPSHVNPQLQQSATNWANANAAFQDASAGPSYKDIQGLNTDVKADQVGGLQQAQALNVNAGQNIVGQNADDLRSQQLSQAATAAASPSSAAAQMAAAGTQIQNQQAGMAATARGADRASARRDAMLATGTQGMQAASTSAALAAQEQAAKQQAYTGALAGVRSGDVSTANTALAAQQSNQSAGLQATQLNNQGSLTAQQANQGADLQAAAQNNSANLAEQQANQNAALTAYGAQNQAMNAYLQSGNQATSAGNQANATVAQYQANWDKDKAQQNQNAADTATGLLSAVGLSDEEAKSDITPVGGGDSLDGLMTGASAPLGDEFQGGLDTSDLSKPNALNWGQRFAQGRQAAQAAHLTGAPTPFLPQSPSAGLFQPEAMTTIPDAQKKQGGGIGGLLSGLGLSVRRGTRLTWWAISPVILRPPRTLTASVTRRR